MMTDQLISVDTQIIFSSLIKSISLNTRAQRLYVYMYICVCVYIYIHMCVFIYIYIFIHICVYIYLYIYVCVCVYIYTYICVCIYIYIQWGKKVFSQPPIVQVLPLKKMREACNFHHWYT